jgi:L-2-hydroxyglutarate oxidase LhgO
MTTPIQSTNHPDVGLVGAGIMSATLVVILRELDPGLKIALYEVLGSEAQESSNAWNNAGTGHEALCELNYIPTTRRRLRNGSRWLWKAAIQASRWRRRECGPVRPWITVR